MSHPPAGVMPPTATSPSPANLRGQPLSLTLSGILVAAA